MGNTVEEQFQNIYKAYQAPLQRYLSRCIGNDADAADLAQEAFLRLYEKRIQPEMARNWLFRTGYHLFVDQWRRRKRMTSMPLEALPEIPCDPAVEPEHEAEKAELHTAVEDALAQLNPRDRNALLLLAYGGASYQEIARRIGCTENGVKTVIHRARKRIKTHFQSKESLIS